MGDKEALRSPPTLTQDIGLPCCMLTAVSAGRSRVYSRFIAGLIRLGFTILRSGATIDDGGKSARSVCLSHQLIDRISTCIKYPKDMHMINK